MQEICFPVEALCKIYQAPFRCKQVTCIIDNLCKALCGKYLNVVISDDVSMCKLLNCVQFQSSLFDKILCYMSCSLDYSTSFLRVLALAPILEHYITFLNINFRP